LIAPDGNIRYCVPIAIIMVMTAHKLGFSSVDSCENAGYIHVSVYWSRIDRFVHIPTNPSHAQIDTIRAYCEANNLRLPKCAVYKIVETSDHTIVPMQNLSPAWLKMPRIMRDQFYRLSGD
jgi:hypothetical protein